ERWPRPGCADRCGDRSSRCDAQPRRYAARRASGTPPLLAARVRPLAYFTHSSLSSPHLCLSARPDRGVLTAAATAPRAATRSLVATLLDVPQARLRCSLLVCAVSLRSRPPRRPHHPPVGALAPTGVC